MVGLSEEKKVIREVIPGGRVTLARAVRSYLSQKFIVDRYNAYISVLQALILFYREQGWEELVKRLEGYFEEYITAVNLFSLFFFARIPLGIEEYSSILNRIIRETWKYVPPDVLDEVEEYEVEEEDGGIKGFPKLVRR